MIIIMLASWDTDKSFFSESRLHNSFVFNTTITVCMSHPRVGRKTPETNSIDSKISSKTSRGKKDSRKRHHQRQPGEQQFPIQVPIQVVTG